MNDKYEPYEDDEIDYVDQEECPCCHGVSNPIGSLGNTEWYRCEDCGFEFTL